MAKRQSGPQQAPVRSPPGLAGDRALRPHPLVPRALSLSRRLPHRLKCSPSITQNKAEGEGPSPRQRPVRVTASSDGGRAPSAPNGWLQARERPGARGRGAWACRSRGPVTRGAPACTPLPRPLPSPWGRESVCGSHTMAVASTAKVKVFSGPHRAGSCAEERAGAGIRPPRRTCSLRLDGGLEHVEGGAEQSARPSRGLPRFCRGAPPEAASLPGACGPRVRGLSRGDTPRRVCPPLTPPRCLSHALGRSKVHTRPPAQFAGRWPVETPGWLSALLCDSVLLRRLLGMNGRGARGAGWGQVATGKAQCQEPEGAANSQLPVSQARTAPHT